MNSALKIVMIVVLTSLLILIRYYENSLFYDPLILYFKSDYSNLPLPEIESFKFTYHLVFRYFLNAIISLAILALLFKDKGVLKLSGLLYVMFFIILLSVLYYLIFISTSNSLLTIFYLRRFLIQPLLVLVLIPAFYFQRNH